MYLCVYLSVCLSICPCWCLCMHVHTFTCMHAIIINEKRIHESVEGAGRGIGKGEIG